MKISLIIPVYNEEPFVRRCLDSVAKQKDNQLQVIVIDDCSKDGSLKICKEYEQFGFEVHHFERNRGLSYVRNYGISHAVGDYIAFLDSDDELTPTAVQIWQKAINKHPRAEIMQFNHLRHYASINKTVRKYDNRDGVFGITNLRKCQCWWGAWNKLIKRDAITRQLRVELGKYGEDGVWMLELALDGHKITAIDKETVIHYFENPKSLTKSKTKREIDILDHAQREILSKHCGVSEPWENIATIVECINDCRNNPHYRALREKP